MSSPPIAVFDLDGTITRRDTFLPFLLSFGIAQRRWIAILQLPFIVLAYVIGIQKDFAAKEKLLTIFLRNQEVKVVENHARQFAESWVHPRINFDVIERLRTHQRQGDRVLILSASPDVYVKEIAASLNISEVICTEVLKTPQSYVGKLKTPNCKGQEKLTRLMAYLGQSASNLMVTAYGDSRHDIPVLEWSKESWWVRDSKLIPFSKPLNE